MMEDHRDPNAAEAVIVLTLLFLAVCSSSAPSILAVNVNLNRLQ